MKSTHAQDLQALIDHDLLARLLDESLPYLSVGEGSGKSWPQRLRNWL
ncbi:MULTISPECIES: hypothetical protein [Methylobacter]|nr:MULTISPECIES: hypothetical protein [Methylobacter]